MRMLRPDRVVRRREDPLRLMRRVDDDVGNDGFKADESAEDSAEEADEGGGEEGDEEEDEETASAAARVGGGGSSAARLPGGSKLGGGGGIPGGGGRASSGASESEKLRRDAARRWAPIILEEPRRSSDAISFNCTYYVIFSCTRPENTEQNNIAYSIYSYIYYTVAAYCSTVYTYTDV